MVAFHTPNLLESAIELFNGFVQLLQFLAEWVGLGLLRLRLRLDLIQIGPEEVERVAVLACDGVLADGVHAAVVGDVLH